MQIVQSADPVRRRKSIWKYLGAALLVGVVLAVVLGWQTVSMFGAGVGQGYFRPTLVAVAYILGVSLVPLIVAISLWAVSRR